MEKREEETGKVPCSSSPLAYFHFLSMSDCLYDCLSVIFYSTLSYPFKLYLFNLLYYFLVEWEIFIYLSWNSATIATNDRTVFYYDIKDNHLKLFFGSFETPNSSYDTVIPGPDPSPLFYPFTMDFMILEQFKSKFSH